MNFTYEDKHDEIESLLEKARKRWELRAIAWMDYDDVKQIIRSHLAKKWPLWDQSRPFGPWCNRTIIRQILNQVRNNYGAYCRPCLKCKHNLGNDSCALTQSKIQDSSCPEFKKWETGGKKSAYDIKIPIPLEDGALNLTTCLYSDFDQEKSAQNLHIKVLQKLSGLEKEIYQILFIDGKNDDEAMIVLRMGPLGAKATNKKLEELKKTFYLIAKEILEDEDILE